MALKAQLSVILKADDVVVAETNDLALWLNILGTLTEVHQSKSGHSSPSEHGGHEEHVHNQG